jgi:hypothetical protein
MTDLALSPQDALVAVMVAVSVSDETIRTAELVKIEQIVNNLPVFGDYDADRTTRRGADGVRTVRGRGRARRAVRPRARGPARTVCGKRPTRSPATWPPPMARSSKTELRFSRGTAPRARHRPAPCRRDRTGRAGAAHHALAEHRAPAADKRPAANVWHGGCRSARPAGRSIWSRVRRSRRSRSAQNTENARLRPDGTCT